MNDKVMIHVDAIKVIHRPFQLENEFIHDREKFLMKSIMMNCLDKIV